MTYVNSQQQLEIFSEIQVMPRPGITHILKKKHQMLAVNDFEISRVMRKPTFCIYAKTKVLISFAVMHQSFVSPAP